MGCDIHVMVEKRSKENGEWETYCKGNEAFWLYLGDDYNLFAIFADVRNGYGFAGCDTGDGFIPIAGQRGVPADASDNYLEYVKKWRLSGHSHSYLTVAELQHFDWEGQKTKHRGYLSQKNYALFKQTGERRRVSDDIGGPSIRKVPNEIMDEILNGELEVEEGIYCYTQIEWEETYKESCSYFVDEDLPELVKIAKDYKCSTEDIRLVFFFDN
ncbi:hypothetical protein HB904_17155 [Listeria booriae]|uniref:Uncharacterized protein n=1 Tax=Listeria booriae TaxID=1552123 RepID=A0A842AJ12_9LIST|nr:hypothetical protein [Listeria booriae]MBC1403135.1 hypothetical protein [Listeria booriae]MBC1617909.1 hypothetical protein [Listeria booriae]